MPDQRILVAGAGIAGLTTALAFAAKGFLVEIHERAPKLEEAGAGLQLSPNATHILDRLGVLDRLLPHAVEPEAVILRDARTLREAARVPVNMARQRWGAPYLVAHRADLQGALLSCVHDNERIRLTTDATVEHIDIQPAEAGMTIRHNDRNERRTGDLVVAADGVWSVARSFIGGTTAFAGDVAWRTTLAADSPAGQAFASVASTSNVTAFMHPSAHIIAYPIRGGRSINLVVLARDPAMAKGTRPATGDPHQLAGILRGTAPQIASLAQAAGPWTLWPLHMAKADAWVHQGRLALVGDAAHALTPFAAQGAVMAIEDAAVLAALVAATPDNLAQALESYQDQRQTRVAKVARRGALNRFTWHAAGPVAMARNVVLKLLPATKLATDLDWLYGWKAPDSQGRR